MELGSVVEGKVTRITNFGAFVELEDGQSGLIHISEVADEYVSDVSEFLTKGETVTAKVISIDQNGKIALSLKKMKPPTQTEKNFQPAKPNFRNGRPNRQVSAAKVFTSPRREKKFTPALSAKLFTNSASSPEFFLSP